MFVFQIVLLVFGVVSGLLLARHVQALPGIRAARGQMLVAYGGGLGAWIAFAAIALSGPMRWTFLGTAVAIYLPSLIVIGSSGQPLAASQNAGPPK